jgi:membrane protein DedA with SNARE-associated domain
VEHLLSTWGYLALFVATMASTTGIPVGSELAILYAGALASGEVVTGSHDHLHLSLVILVAIAGEVCGSVLGYIIGLLGGRPLVNRLGRYVLIAPRDLERAEGWFARHGDGAVFFGRFVPLLRSFISLAAGVTEMDFVRFLAFSIPACAIWCTGLALAGDALGHSWHRVASDIGHAGYILGALVLVVLVFGLVHRYQSVRRSGAGAHSAAK